MTLMEEYYSNKVMRESRGTGSGSGSGPNLAYSSSSSAAVDGSISSVGNHHHALITHATTTSSSTFHLQSPHPHQTQIFHYPLSITPHLHSQPPTQTSDDVEAMKAKIIAHPHYSNLLQAYINCQKVGAPPEVAARLGAARQEFEARQRSSVRCKETCKDPELDQFMEAYYDMLVKYGEELARPIQEATDFMRNIETQLNQLCNGSFPIFSSEEKGGEGVESSEEEENINSDGETQVAEIDGRNVEDRELKNQLVRKYSGYLSSLKQELSKKKKKGKLPKDARQKLLNWWELHYKWPYPSESEKVALAESTGLDQKQINNWFINQRKRHWKASEDMQFMAMDGLQLHPPNHSLYVDDPHYISLHAHHYRLL